MPTTKTKTSENLKDKDDDGDADYGIDVWEDEKKEPLGPPIGRRSKYFPRKTNEKRGRLWGGMARVPARSARPRPFVRFIDSILPSFT